MRAQTGDCSSYLCVQNGREGDFFGGYSSSMLICSSSSGVEKNVFMNALVFSSFDVASVAGLTSCFSRFSMGTQALPPLDGAPDVYWCAVHTVLFSTHCRKSSQCVLFAVLITFHMGFLLLFRFCVLAHQDFLSGCMSFFLIFIIPFISAIVLLTTIALLMGTV